MSSRYVLKIHPSILEQETEYGGEMVGCPVGQESVEWSEKLLAATLLCRYTHLYKPVHTYL